MPPRRIHLIMISRNTKIGLNAAAFIILILVIIVSSIRIISILGDSAFSSVMIYEVLVSFLPVLLAILVVTGFLLIRSGTRASSGESPQENPGVVSGSEKVLYDIPADESYLPTETYIAPKRQTKALTSSPSPSSAQTPAAPPAQNASLTDKSEDSQQKTEQKARSSEETAEPPEDDFFKNMEDYDRKIPSAAKQHKPHDESEKTQSGSIVQNIFSGRQKAVRALAGDIKNDAPAHQELLEVQEDTFETRLSKELLFSQEHGYDVSLALIRFRFKDKTKAVASMPSFAKVIHTFLGNSAYIYQYKESMVKNSYACIMPFANFSETQAELLALYRYMKDVLDEQEILFSSGFTSRFNRALDADIFLNEASSSLKKALRRRSFSLIGFEPDLDSFETNLKIST